jgi:hypothetical protein
VDEGHGSPLAGKSGTCHGRAEVVDQLANGLFSLLVAGCAAAGAHELAEQPQQQQRLVRCPLLVDRCLSEPGQLRQQLVAGQAVAFSWSVKVFQVSGAKASWGPSGVFAVADGYGWAGGADLDAGSAVGAAVAARAPRNGRQVHRSSATFS